MEELTIIKLAILNDLISIELSNIPIDRVSDPKLKCRLRNAKKAAETLIDSFDELLSKNRQEELFGDICDSINKSINQFLKDNIC